MDITKFGLKNFRIFKEHFDFELAPIMILTGPNNSGKSSLSKALLLLKENEDKFDDASFLVSALNYFKGEHDLGNHKLTINTKDEITNFSFTFFLGYKFYIGIDNDGKFSYDYVLKTENNEFIMMQMGAGIEINVPNIIRYFKDRVTLGQTKEFPNAQHDNIDFKKIEKLISNLEDFGNTYSFIDVDLNDTGYIEGKYVNKPPTEEENKQNGIFSPPFFEYDAEFIREDLHWQENLIFLFYKITDIKLTDDEIRYLIPTSANEYSTKGGFLKFQDIVYVNTIKEPLKRAYSKNDISAFQSLIIDEITRDINKNIDGRSNNKYQINTLEETKSDLPKSKLLYPRETYELFTRKWLKEFEIGKELSYGYDEKNDIFFIKVDNKSLPEYGLGYGLIIHILLALSNEIRRYTGLETQKDLVLYFPRTYIIEEPETGLHPAFQSKMAEMLVDLQKTFKVNLIIETHSEYFIRKLQYLTATNEINPGDAVIYYFNNPKKIPENEEQIKKITIDKNGSLSDSFGPGFIDEGTNLKFEILRLNRDRQN